MALQPLSDRLAQKLRERQSLPADEPPVQQLDPGKGKTKRAYLWAYRSNDLDGDPLIVMFDYQTSRSGQHARDFLRDWRGLLIVDDFSGYKKMLIGEHITDQACLAHARQNSLNCAPSKPKRNCSRCTTGCWRCGPMLPMAAAWAEPSITHCGAGRHLPAMPKPAICPSTTIRSRMPSVQLPSKKRTGYSVAANAPDGVPPRFKACWPPPSSTAWSLSPG